MVLASIFHFLWVEYCELLFGKQSKNINIAKQVQYYSNLVESLIVFVCYMNFIFLDKLWAKSTQLFITIAFNHVLFYNCVVMCLHLKINVVMYCQSQVVFILTHPE